MEKAKFLVPTDFTPVSDCAVKHAIKTATKVGAEVNLLHIVEKQGNIEDAKLKLKNFATTIKSDHPGLEVNTIIRIGNIFEDIGDVAQEIGAMMIFMGTHGATGMQHVTGSYALRVITNSDIPFVVVQEKDVKVDGYSDIVMPIDLTVETKQKLRLTKDMAKYFGSKIHLITPKEEDEWLQNKVTRNLNYAKEYLESNGCEFDTVMVEDAKSNFAKEVVKYSAKIDADLICIMNLFKNYLLFSLSVSYEQHLITNEAQIPVMVINPIDTYGGGGQGLFS